MPAVLTLYLCCAVYKKRVLAEKCLHTDSDAGVTAVMPAVSLCGRTAVSPGSDPSNPPQLSPHEVLPAPDETAAGTDQTLVPSSLAVVSQ